MSLNKYRTDPKLSKEGVWVAYPANKDGSIPAFKLARASAQNSKYAMAIRKLAEKTVTSTGTPDFSKLGDADLSGVELDIFIDSILVDWRHIQPNDDGEEIPYSQEAAKMFFGSDEWFDLYIELSTQANNIANFRVKQLEAEAKN